MTYEYWILISLSCTSFSRCDWGFRTSLLITVQWNTKSDFSFLGNIKFQTAYQLHYRIHERKKSETTRQYLNLALRQNQHLNTVIGIFRSFDYLKNSIYNFELNSTWFYNFCPRQSYHNSFFRISLLSRRIYGKSPSCRVPLTLFYDSPL